MGGRKTLEHLILSFYTWMGSCSLDSLFTSRPHCKKFINHSLWLNLFTFRFILSNLGLHKVKRKVPARLLGFHLHFFQLKFMNVIWIIIALYYNYFFDKLIANSEFSTWLVNKWNNWLWVNLNSLTMNFGLSEFGFHVLGKVSKWALS